MLAPSRWPRLWFGFSDPVDRGTYLRHGLGLMALKYAIDALLIWRFAGRIWTLSNYLSPLLSTRQAMLRDAPPWLLPLMVVIALPFLWIGVSMSMRRAVDAGLSPGLALLFFVPGVNFLLMLGLCLPDSQRYAPGTSPAPRLIAKQERMQAAML